MFSQQEVFFEIGPLILRSPLAVISLHLISKQQGQGIPSIKAVGFVGNINVFVSQVLNS